MPRAALFVALLGLFTGLGAPQASRSSGRAPTALPAPLPALAAALGASGADTFRTPSGNIYCAYEHYSFAPIDLRCEIRSGIKPLPAKPASCQGDWGAGYAMRQTGAPHVLCITDTIYDSKATVLAYGTTRQFGVFKCSSSAAGLRCANASGRGFLLSKEHSYTFSEPPPKNGAFKTPSGNIVCGYSIAPSGEASMECGIKSGLKPPPKQVHCDAGDPNDKRVSLRDAGRAVPVLCAGDPGPLLPQIQAKARVLAYGSTTRVGAISCTSETTGLTCRNRSGHGFFLSRERWRTF
jgi:uncharacterized protein DUF6636